MSETMHTRVNPNSNESYLGLRRRNRGLNLFALTAFAIGQPLLELLGRNAEFFVSRSADRFEILLMVLVLLMGPGIVLFLLAEGVGLVMRRAVLPLHLILVSLLAALVCLVPINRMHVFAVDSSLAGVGELAFAVLIGAAIGILYARSAAVRGVVGLLACAPALFAVAFLIDADVRKLLARSDSEHRPAFEIRQNIDTPVVFVLFDELPLSSLIGSEREIDPIRYPAFAELAHGSTWFRGASAIAPFTSVAVPGILTGRRPPLEKPLPILADYPENIFALFQRSMTLNIHESETALQPQASGGQPPPRQRAPSLVSDLTLIYLHMVFPERYAAGLPSVTMAWGRFADAEFKLAMMALPRLTGNRKEPERFRSFVASIAETSSATAQNGDPPAPFHFIHVMLPHGPLNYTSSGRIYAPTGIFGTSRMDWSKERWWTLAAYQRHLFQLELADRLLGELIVELRRLNLYDQSLLIVTADHGISFWPGSSMRSVAGHDNPADIISVPLFIKRPGQSQGSVSDRTVELIDIVPTIGDVLDVEIPWHLDGCSIFDASCPEREERIVLTSERPEIRSLIELHLTPDIVFSERTVKRKLNFFGSGARPHGLYRFGPYAKFAGRNLEELSPDSRPRGVVSLEHGAIREGHQWRATSVRIIGELQLAQPVVANPYIAFVINGKIETIVPAINDGKVRYRVAAMLPEVSLGADGARLELYLVDASESPARLVALNLE